MTQPPPAPERATGAPGVFSREFLWLTLGSCALVFLGAFESLAVTTVMPVVSDDLGGEHLYALAFAGPLATGVIGMVVAGNWSDRWGPKAPLYAAAVVFAVGLLIAGTAPTMEVLLVGRLLQGFGTGAVTVALYVVVARLYPARLHPSIFAGFAAAWVIPSIIGPAAAGAVTELFSWHWVFLGVVGLVAVATAMIAPVLHRRLATRPALPAAPWRPRPIVWATIAAGAVLGLNLTADIVVVGPVVAVAAGVLVLIAVRPLLPPATLRAHRGLPSVILLRGLTAASFFSAEVYLPYLFIEDYEFSPTIAGIALTAAAITWAGASWLQGRWAERMPHTVATVTGSVLVLVSIVAALMTAWLHLPPTVAIVGWALGGAGMGLMYPRISTMTLAYSTPHNQGFNSSAMSIGDSLGAALALAVGGLVFAASGFAGVFAFAAAVAVAAIVVAPRVWPDPPRVSSARARG